MGGWTQKDPPQLLRIQFNWEIISTYNVHRISFKLHYIFLNDIEAHYFCTPTSCCNNLFAGDNPEIYVKGGGRGEVATTNIRCKNIFVVNVSYKN